MKFKTSELEQEFNKGINKRLQTVLFALDGYMSYMLGKEATITCLLRTQKEQDLLVEAGFTSEKTSVHQLGRGADVRANDLDVIEQVKVENFLNNNFMYGKETIRTCFTHGKDSNIHFHIQVIETNYWR